MADPPPRSGAGLLPSGTVTFLFSGVHGSALLWERHRALMRQALIRHDAIVDAAVHRHAGLIVRGRGDGDSVFAVFGRASDAVTAARDMQLVLQAEPWPPETPIRVRIGVHTGEADLRDGDYSGAVVNRCAGLRDAAHGGQILLSQATHDLIDNRRPEGLHTIDLGEHRLRETGMPEHIFQLLGDGLPADFPPLRGMGSRPVSLPAQRSALIGRERELADVRTLLLRPHVGLLTLIGPGGIGKTRLAVQVASNLADQFEAGVYFVALAAIRDPALVAPTIGQALSLSMDGDRPPLEVLKDHLRDRELLLVLDNLEQVLEAADQLVELLAAAGRLKLLVTSRVALRVSYERIYEVAGLGLPARDHPAPDADQAAALGTSDAVRLFVERAQAVQTDFALARANATAVAEICRRLDGMPLAIELAAARVRLLPPSAMLTRLTGPTTAPSLHLLTGGPRDQPPRLQTLRDTIAWSYDLLEPEEQVLFRRLAIFVGGCTLDAIEGVGAWVMGVGGTGESAPNTYDPAPDTLDRADSLLSKSLLRRVDGPAGEPRYTMLETLREYGLERLGQAGELASLRRWHAEYFLALAELAVPLLRGGEQAAWLDRLEAEYDNLRAALEWSLGPDGDTELGLRLCGALAWFWRCRAHLGEARRWLTLAVQRSSGPSPGRVAALAGAGWLAHVQHDSAAARPLLEEGLALARARDDRWWVAWLLHVLGRVAYFDGDAQAARSLGDESLVVSRGIGDAWLAASALHLLGLAAHIADDFATAKQRYEESLAIHRRLDCREGAGTVHSLLGVVAYREGQYLAARDHFRNAMTLIQGIDWGWLMGNFVAQMTALAMALGQPERAARLSGALIELSEAVSSRPIPLVEAILMPAVEQARRALGDEAFAAEQQAGRRLSHHELLAEAFAVDISPRG